MRALACVSRRVRSAAPSPVRSPGRPLRESLGPLLALTFALPGAGCVGARLGGPVPLSMAAQSALPERGQVILTLEPGGVAVLTGWTESEIGEMAVVREVGARPEVVEVVNLIRRPLHLDL